MKSIFMPYRHNLLMSDHAIYFNFIFLLIYLGQTPIGFLILLSGLDAKLGRRDRWHKAAPNLILS